MSEWDAEVAVVGLGAWGFGGSVVARSAGPVLAGVVGHAAAVASAGVQHAAQDAR
ncbi:hypothetical protein IAG44_00900 [Streptomyces roseirectus]|uniref:Uncharacterized protein n=1 Tax=Streptomyces roseirectus TaxID=2768066 RepID=A0A7H0I5U9_9ACTN|nr:hypothetical protein [Streptomyces roseirectus]QNP68165.1 hypothetical protein IAG44_00900 [Streptomyces roseirectus]